ncbi:MAG: hypothetical protein AAFP84_04390 [Actinomycetota bacterium]
MKSLFVVAGAAPKWVAEQIRYTAQQLTDDGGVTVAFTGGIRSEHELPGAIGPSTLLGFSPSGKAIPTARLSTALGVRPKHDNTILTVFDEGRPTLALTSGLVARLRGERVVLHDLRSETRPASPIVDKLLSRIAHDRVAAKAVEYTHERSVALAVCDGDVAFTELVVRAINSMAGEAVSDWRFVIQTSSDEVERIIADAPRRDLMTIERGDVQDELLDMCDVVIAPHGPDAHFAATAVARGAAGIVAGQEIADRLVRRVDGVWLARRDASSLLVALESARAGLERRGRWAPEIRALGDQVVEAVRR